MRAMSSGNHVLNTLASLLQSAVSTRSPFFGRASHAKIIKTIDFPFPTFICNHLVNMYSKLDLLDSAQIMLSLIPAQNRSVVTWTALISGCVQNGHFSSAIFHFSNMYLKDFIQPNDFTFPCVFKACNSLKCSVSGRQIHALAIKSGQMIDVFVGCSAFDMYSKMGLKEDAGKVFDEMPDKNLATWNAYISNAVLDGESRKSVEAFIELRRIGGNPSSITFCVVLNACSDALYLQLGKQVHGIVIRSGYEFNVSVANGLINFYGKCRDISSSGLAFKDIRIPNDVSWCSMVAAYEQNDDIEPKDFIISSVLSACAGIAGLEIGRLVHALAVKACIDACSRSGAVKIGMYIFDSMIWRYGTEPVVEHYACVVDCNSIWNG